MIQKIVVIGAVSLLCCLSLTPGLLAARELSVPQLSLGNTLYVGGSGPGNYSTIQDAVNASVDGDTIFVYQYSSPYKENIVIGKSISLIGENLNTTIENERDDLSNILIRHDSVKISIFKFPAREGSSTDICSENSSSINISNCILIGSYYGIVFNNIKDSIIYHNTFDGVSPFTILLSESNGNIISSNKIYVDSMQGGIIINNGSSKNTIIENDFEGGINPTFGIRIFNAGEGNIILNNNLNCGISSDVRSHWHGNYYRDWIGHQIKVLFFFPRIILSSSILVLMINIDWHPARHPYDIQWS